MIVSGPQSVRHGRANTTTSGRRDHLAALGGNTRVRRPELNAKWQSSPEMGL